MKFARGPEGFKVVAEPSVQAMVDDVLENHPDFAWRWEAVLARLRMTAHVEGDAVADGGAARAGCFELEKWRVKLAWRIVGARVWIKRAEF